MIDRDAITRAKLALPLPDLWRKLGWPGEPKKSCRRPYSPEDTRDSASVFQKASGEWSFHDFKAGETWDEIGLLAQVESLSNGDACRRFLALAGIKGDSPHTPAPAAASKPLPPPDVKPERKPFIGTLRELAREECEAIAAGRGSRLAA